MGFFDSMKTGIGAFGDFLGDLTGAALKAAPTIVPLLQSTGVIPQVQPSPIVTSRGYGGGPLGQYTYPGFATLPGGAQVPQTATNPMSRPIMNLPTGNPVPATWTPVGASPMPSFQSTQNGFANAAFSLPQIGGGTGLDLPFIDIVRQGGSNALAKLTSPFVPTMAGARAQPFVAQNPVTGASTWFKPAGRPILWSGDLTACKRVNKLAMRARRAKR